MSHTSREGSQASENGSGTVAEPNRTLENAHSGSVASSPRLCHQLEAPLEEAPSIASSTSSSAALEARLLAQLQALNLTKARAGVPSTMPLSSQASFIPGVNPMPYQGQGQMPMTVNQQMNMSAYPDQQGLPSIDAATLAVLQAARFSAAGTSSQGSSTTNFSHLNPGFGLPNQQQFPMQRKATVRDEEKVRRTVYITDVDPRANETDLLTLFADCAPIVDWRICGDPNSTMRFAFIEFGFESIAKMALAKTGTLLGSFPIRVAPSKTSIVPVNNQYLPRSAEEMQAVARTVYIANIDRLVERETVRDFFSRLCGPILKIRLLGDTQHNTKIAFIEFGSLEIAKLALKCSGAMLGSLPLRVSPSKTPVRSDAGKRANTGGGGNNNTVAHQQQHNQQQYNQQQQPDIFFSQGQSFQNVDGVGLQIPFTGGYIYDGG